MDILPSVLYDIVPFKSAAQKALQADSKLREDMLQQKSREWPLPKHFEIQTTSNHEEDTNDASLLFRVANCSCVYNHKRNGRRYTAV